MPPETLALVYEVQIGQATATPQGAEVCRVHGLLHHILVDHNEQEWQQYAALLVSRGTGEERCNAGGCLDTATRVIL